MIAAARMQDFAARGLSPTQAAREAGVARATICRAEVRSGVTLTRKACGDEWVVDHRAAVQDMKLLDAVEYLLDVIERIVIPGDAAVAWDWPGVHLAPQQKRLVYALASARATPVSREALWHAIRSSSGAEDAPNGGKLVDVVLSRVRPVLQAAGIRVVTTFGMGWHLEVPPGFVWPWGAA